MVAETQSKVKVCLELAEAEDGEEGGESDGEEAGAGSHHGPARFRFGAFLSHDSFRFLHPINVGSGFRCQGRIC